MGKEKVEALVEGGKATPAPPLGPALGPLGVPIGKVVAEINAKTKAFNGMKVPVTVTVDPKTREFELEIGTPPTTALILNKLKKDKGAQKAKEEIVGSLKIEEIVELYKDTVSIAAINSPRSVTISGDAESLKDIADVLEEKDIFARFLRVEVPYHSPVMDTILPEFKESLRKQEF